MTKDRLAALHAVSVTMELVLLLLAWIDNRYRPEPLIAFSSQIGWLKGERSGAERRNLDRALCKAKFLIEWMSVEEDEWVSE